MVRWTKGTCSWIEKLEDNVAMDEERGDEGDGKSKIDLSYTLEEE